MDESSGSKPQPKIDQRKRNFLKASATFVGSAALAGVGIGLGLDALLSPSRSKRTTSTATPPSDSSVTPAPPATDSEIIDPIQERINALKDAYMANYTADERSTAEGQIQAWVKYFKDQSGEGKLNAKIWTEDRPNIEKAEKAVEGLSKGRFKVADVDLDVVMGIIRAESSADPNAGGDTHDVGLGQLNPDAVADVKKVLNWQGEPNLKDPLTNIIFALGYLKLLEEMIKEKDSALVAYHVGPGRLRDYKIKLREQGSNFNPTHFENLDPYSQKAQNYFYDILGATISILEAKPRTKA